MPRSILLFAMLLAVAAPLPAADAIPWSADWARDSIWDDGKAEMSTYDSTRTVYGKVRNFDSMLIVVKEDMSLEEHVKANYPAKGPTRAVLKMNLAQTFQTENYPYHFLTSVFVEREKPWNLLKETMTSQEWCGTTFNMVAPWMDGGALVTHSYWRGEADRTIPMRVNDAELTEEQLLVTLRSIDFEAAAGNTYNLQVLDNLISNRAPVPDWNEVQLTVDGDIDVTVPAGDSPAHRIQLTYNNDDTAAFIFHAESPHRLLRAEYRDGRTLTLKKTERRAYWR